VRTKAPPAKPAAPPSGGGSGAATRRPAKKKKRTAAKGCANTSATTPRTEPGARQLNLPSCAVVGLEDTVDLNAAKDADGHVGTILLKAKIDGTSAICLFDTGAETNFLSHHFVERHGLHTRLEPSQCSVRYADGTVKAARGEITLPLQLLAERAPFACSTRFVVADLQRQFDLILGIPFCREHEPSPDWAKMTIKLLDQRPGRNRAWRAVYKASPRRPGEIEGDFKGRTLGEISLGAMDQLRSSNGLIEWCLINLRPSVSCTAAATGPDDPEHAKLAALCARLFQEYKDVFPDTLPKVDPNAKVKEGAVVHRIELTDGAKPYSQPLRRMSTQELDELKKQLQEYLDSGRIRPSESPWGTNVIFAKKKDGTLRFCVDYRGLNDRTLKNKYPLPHTEELFDRLTGAKYFSKLDLRSGFFQILLAEGDRSKTAFRTRYGLFEWTVLPMGLTNAPATFQHLMNHTFRDFLDLCVLVFLDDIVVYSKTLSDHERDVRAVLQRLRDAGLCAKASKCELFMEEIEFLGHHVGRNGLRVMPDKVEAVRKWPQPQNATDLRSFLGLAGYYRRFVEGFSEIAAPLHELTQTKIGSPPFRWDTKHQTAFDALKKRLAEAPVLALPDPDKAYVVNTDASDYATGAVLQQDHGSGLQPVAYVSHKMLPAELNYQVHDKEMLAIIKMLGEWRTYLHGRQPFTIRIKTDHNSLQYFMTKPDLTGRQARWLEKLADYDFKIEYVKGATNTAADALSRMPCWSVAPLTLVSTLALSIFDREGRVEFPKDEFMELCGMRKVAGGRKWARPPKRPVPPDTPAEAAQRAEYISYAEASQQLAGDRPQPNKRGAIVTKSQRCTAQTESGDHCRQRTAKGQYCYSHRRGKLGIRVGKSDIPGAGYGVIATRALPRRTRVLYTGDLVPLHNDRDGGPYFLELTHDQAVDAARTNTAEGRWINDPKGTGKRANCRFVIHRGKACVETTRALNAGEELLVSYGAGYWRYHGAGGPAKNRPAPRKAARIAAAAPRKGPPGVRDNAGLSCAPAAAMTPPSATLIELIRAAAKADTEYQAALAKPTEFGYASRDSLLYRDGLVVIPRDQPLRVRILAELHDAASAGHTGVASTFDRLSSRVYWGGMRADVHAYVTSCDSCQRNKVEQRKTAGLLRPPPIPGEPGYALNMDFVTGLPRTPRGHTAYLSITCRLSNMLQVGLCNDNVTASQAAQLVFDNWVTHYGLPAEIISDRDPRFLGEFWKALWKIMGSSLLFSTAGHPQTDGKAENRQRTANTMLRHYVSFEQTDWDLQLTRAVFAINHTRSASTQLTPFEVMLGRSPRLPLDTALEPLRAGDSADGRVPAAHDFAARFATLWRHAQHNLQRAQADQKRFADKHRREEHFAVGELVLLSVRDLKFINPADARRSAKFTARFVGPFPVKRIINENAYELDLPKELRIHPTQNVSKLRRWISSPSAFNGRPQDAAVSRPPPDMVDAAGNEEYAVERILAKRQTGRNGRVTEYLIKWVGYPNEDCSWITQSRLNCPDLLADFLSTHDDRRDVGP
jgi:hypothetical protein